MARTQENRQAELISPLGTDVLLFHHLVARESVSQLYDYDLMVFSEDENIVLDDLIGQHAHVELELPHGDTRYFCGHVTRFSFLGFRGPLAKYKVELKPWFWFLTRAVNNRIFQNETVPEIIKKVCADHGFTDIDDRLTSSYDPREFCVQYRESDFAFLSRLMEEEGIYYYFTHEPGKHELVLADSISAHEPFGDYAVVPYFPPDQHDHRERDHIDAWQVSRAVRSGKIALRDYNFATPGANMEVKAQMIRDYEHAEYEQYDYPGDYSTPGEGEAYARLRLEAEQADIEILRGGGNARGLIPGFLFELEDYPRDDQNREYLILAVTHDIMTDEFDAEVEAGESEFNYSCSLMAMPSSEPFRAACRTPRPIVHGPQTGVVVGESGEEIWTDEHGRVKVQFHWDREGQKNENSSCWIRVAQGWAGKKWGMQFLPRIGHEVVVEFLEGDPDRPLVTGSVYNAENKPPYDLPAKATQSGIKTRSSKNGSASNFNEFRFEDKKGSELIYVHAEKDRHSEVENDDALNIGNDRKKTIGGNETIHVKKNRKDNIDLNLDQEVGVHRTIKVGTKSTGNDKLEVSGKREVDVKKDYKLDIDGNYNVTVKGAWTHKSKKITMTSETSIDITAQGGGIDVTASAPVTINAPAGVFLNDSQLHTTSGTVINVFAMINVSGGNCTETKASDSVWKGFDQSYKGFDIGMKISGLSVSGISLEHTTLKIGSPGLELKKIGSLKMEASGFKIDKSGFKML
ncbi:MAG: type VI secretion system tip protein VgrG [Wenzhouxiangella sp.]|nr:type VI secretion system tip protein VgrG [Wenzhouxiangella sp.]MCH8477293.1 type VI secretion system tip protein VgrG [Wenzhouxiangella sp.]TVR95953.1 MAG: type VI secretion system tip protein VgrG [Wenzhouxiangellaceae bacterium]